MDLSETLNEVREYTVKVELGTYEFNAVLAHSPQEAVQIVMADATKQILTGLLAQAIISVTPERTRWKWPREEGKEVIIEKWVPYED